MYYAYYIVFTLAPEKLALCSRAIRRLFAVSDHFWSFSWATSWPLTWTDVTPHLAEREKHLAKTSELRKICMYFFIIFHFHHFFDRRQFQ